MDNMKDYRQILKNRQISKQIQQLSWNLNKMEQKFRFEQMTEEDFKVMNDFYMDTFKDFKKLSSEL